MLQIGHQKTMLPFHLFPFCMMPIRFTYSVRDNSILGELQIARLTPDRRALLWSFVDTFNAQAVV
jgi:hypothetical protein